MHAKEMVERAQIFAVKKKLMSVTADKFVMSKLPRAAEYCP